MAEVVVVAASLCPPPVLTAVYSASVCKHILTKYTALRTGGGRSDAVR